MGRHAVEAGADLVVGHHSHALQAVEFYQGVPIVYGLGNFYLSFEEGFPRESMLLQCTISQPHKIDELAFLPVYITDDNRPEVISPCSANGKRIVALMQKLCWEYGSTVVAEKCTPTVVLQART